MNINGEEPSVAVRDTWWTQSTQAAGNADELENRVEGCITLTMSLSFFISMIRKG